MKIITVRTKLIFATAVASLISCSNVPEPIGAAAHKGQVFVKAVPFKTATGWGYEIYTGDSLYIRQAIIPGLPGKHSFASRTDALRVGELVIQKMAATNAMPFVSQADLAQLHVEVK